MGFNRDVIRRRRDQLHEWGVRMRWVGRTPAAVAVGHQGAARSPQELTQHNTGLTLYFCVNYGGRAEIADAVQRIADDVAAGRLRPASVDEKTIKRYLDEPTCPTSTCSCAARGSSARANFLLWQSAYAEMVFQNQLWPDYDRRDLWAAIEEYVARDRRYGGAVDTPTATSDGGHRGRVDVRRAGGLDAGRRTAVGSLTKCYCRTDPSGKRTEGSLNRGGGRGGSRRRCSRRRCRRSRACASRR